MIIYTLVYNLESEKITIVIYHYYIFLILSTITASPIAFTFHDTDGMVRNHSNLLRNMGIASGDQWWETCWLRVIAVMLMNGNYFRYLYVFFSQCFFLLFPSAYIIDWPTKTPSAYRIHHQWWNMNEIYNYSSMRYMHTYIYILYIIHMWIWYGNM